MSFIMRIILKKNIYRYVWFSIIFFKCVYFNTFYNAEESFEKALQIIEKSSIIDNDANLPSEALKFLDKTISNCNIVLDKYPDSKYVEKAYLLMGISFFYKQLYQSSIENFNAIINSNDIEIKNKAILWTAYAYLKTSKPKNSAYYLDMLSLQDMDKENSYIYYNIKAETYELNSNIKDAYENYILASDETSKTSRKNYIYRKLIKLSEDSGDLLSKINFIELLEQYVEESNKIKELKIEWIDTKNELKDYKGVVKQIDLIIDDPAFNTIRPQLMIYKAKAYKKDGKKEISKQILNEIIEEFSKKDETSEAYYYLGLFSLFDDFDVQEAEEYFKESISEKSRSKYGKESKKIKDKIEKYIELKADYDYFRNRLDSISNKNNLIDIDGIDEKDGNNINMQYPDVDDEVLLDSLLFNIGQILYFDFNQTYLAINQYQYILEEFPKSRYKNQILNIIDYHNGDSLRIIEEKILNNVNNSDSLSIKRDEAWTFSGIQESLNVFNRMYDNYKDSIALFNAGYIYDHFFYDIEKAVPIYYKLQEEYQQHPKMDYVNNRLIELDSNISSMISENNQKINLYDAFYLIKSNDLDSAKKGFENIQISRTDPMFQSVKYLINQIESYVLMEEEYNTPSDKLKDSLIFHMAKIDYYYFDRVDKAFLNLENIIQKHAKSKYYNQSLWILGQEFDKYKQDSIQYDLIDTSKIVFYNPINDWDIKKVKNEYKKLNNLYNIFKDKSVKDEN